MPFQPGCSRNLWFMANSFMVGGVLLFAVLDAAPVQRALGVARLEPAFQHGAAHFAGTNEDECASGCDEELP